MRGMVQIAKRLPYRLRIPATLFGFRRYQDSYSTMDGCPLILMMGLPYRYKPMVIDLDTSGTARGNNRAWYLDWWIKQGSRQAFQLVDLILIYDASRITFDL